MVDLQAASSFMATHARLLDRHRYQVVLHDSPSDGALAALAAYRNPDGGFGWALEPDLRSPMSQPVGALHAFEVLEEIAPATSPLATGLCDWLAEVTLPDGGLPFALAGANAAGSAPVWAAADPTTSSLHITSAICGYAHRVGAHDPAVAAHPWLQQATDYCWRALRTLREPGGTYELRYGLQFLDAIVDAIPEASSELARLARFVPPSGERVVEGGLEGEKLRPLDFAPLPGRPLRQHLPAEVIDRDLDRLAGEQLDDGGWDVDFSTSSPAAALEWRGYMTVWAIGVLLANQRVLPRAP